MIESLKTHAEKKALEAEELPAFSGIKLLHIKRQLELLLGLIGRDGIFDEYTRHDISHIDEMLNILDWLIPEDTKKIMSPADWLMTVLAIYFHDLGMLVLLKEYEKRNSSGFPDYRDTVLYAGKEGADYREKIEQLSADKIDRFLYQEFVRHNHAKRIKNWIEGRAPENIGITNTVMSEVNNLLSALDPQFRHDLALVCESHHLDDLNDLQKYKVSQPYGNSDEETANLQYAAVMLRTTDLLHITRDRTPSIAFRVINPIDPISQEEWAKQTAVKRVRSKISQDREGNLDKNAPRNTIEVHANFTEEDGFFGLTSYIAFAENQIQKSYDWILASNKHNEVHHTFPWRYFDDSNIETEGFLRNTYGFTINQAKILDLLTGHTLYNDTRVVLRELMQNSLDATRLQNVIDSQQGFNVEPGNVRIQWDSHERTLIVEDNGTGMTQDMVEKHLLQVGTSRYQDPDFKRQYPNFSSISRFGIGLLSTFMIADTVEIITCHQDEEQARQLSLRSVNGKYLIRLLDKQTDEVAKRLAPHGTIIKLKVRQSAEISDVIETARRWIVVPNSKVTVKVDDAPPVQIGYSSLRESLENFLEKANMPFDDDSYIYGKIQIEEKEINGVSLAYAKVWSKFFREWTFLEVPDPMRKEGMLGTCIEGVRIDFNTPGFDGCNIVAISNIKGPNAPKTNVVRTSLEAAPELNEMLKSLYLIYCDHIKVEMQNLHEKRQFSLTWAAQESRYLLNPILPQKSTYRRHIDTIRPINRSLLIEKVTELPLLLVEMDGQRAAVSPKFISRESKFITIDSALFKSAELFIREIAGKASLSNLIENIHPENVDIPPYPMICGIDMSDKLDEYIFENKEVSKIDVYPEQRRVDLIWAEESNPPRWQKVPLELYKKAASVGMADNIKNIRIGNKDVKLSGISNEIAVCALDCIFILPGTQMSHFLSSLLNKLDINQREHFDTIVLTILYVFASIVKTGVLFKDYEDFLERCVRVSSEMGLRRGTKIADAGEFSDFYDLIDTDLHIFNPSALNRNNS